MKVDNPGIVSSRFAVRVQDLEGTSEESRCIVDHRRMPKLEAGQL